MANLNPAVTAFEIPMVAPAGQTFQVGDHHYVPSDGGIFHARPADIPALIEAGATRAAASGPTDQRPTDQLHIGLSFFDVGLNRPVFWDGAAWRDAMGGPA